MAGEASEARLARARRQGDTAVSRRLVQASGLVALLLAFPLCAQQLWGSSEALLRAAIERAAEPEPVAGPELARGVAMSVVAQLLGSLLPLVGAVALGAYGATLLQGGGRWSAKRAPSRRSESWRRALLGAVGALATALVGAHLLRAMLPSLLGSLERGQLGSARVHLMTTLDLGVTHAATLLGAATAVALAAGGLDVVLERLAWRRRHAVSADTERRERRTQEVAPEARAARQRAHRQLARPRAQSTS